MKNAADRATDLLIQRITEGLDPQSEKELEALLADRPDLDAESFELAAAAIELTVTDTAEALPSSLRRQLSIQAEDFFARPTPNRADEANAASHPPANVVPIRPPARESSRSGGLYSNLGWLAAAATLIFSIALWPRVEGPVTDGPVVDPSPGVVTPAVKPEPTPSEARAELIARATDLVNLTWTSTDESSEAGGDVVWSTASQRGFMTFRGLPVNDPSVEQYQLWIFDAEQDERYPVDGGVFDVSDGETIVEIDAKLEIKTPTLFAITVEKPGGVVVSSRERLPLLAQVG